VEFAGAGSTLRGTIIIIIHHWMRLWRKLRTTPRHLEAKDRLKKAQCMAKPQHRYYIVAALLLLYSRYVVAHKNA
jgi:hypothetical protein